MQKKRVRETVTMCVTMPPPLRAEVEEECRALGMTKSEYFRTLHRDARKKRLARGA